MVVGTAVRGRTDEAKGDSLVGFNADITQAEVDAFFAAPKPQSVPLLGAATSRVIYDAHRFHRLAHLRLDESREFAIGRMTRPHCHNVPA